MMVQREFDIREDCWSGAKERIDSMPSRFVDYLENLIVEYYIDLDEVPTDTQVNDFIWFGEDTYADWFGFADGDQMWKYFDLLDSGVDEDDIWIDPNTNDFVTSAEVEEAFFEFSERENLDDYDYESWLDWAEDNDYVAFEPNV